jgi:hypothetical protein
MTVIELNYFYNPILNLYRLGEQTSLGYYGGIMHAVENYLAGIC